AYAVAPEVRPLRAFRRLFHHAVSGSTYESSAGLRDTAAAPRDVFPSLHVAISSIVLYYAWRRGRIWFGVALPLVLANWLSTLYLRYHYLVDVMAGWITAIAAIALAAWILRIEAAVLRSKARPRPSPR